MKAIPFVDGKLSKCERFVPIAVNESDESVCGWSFNQTEVTTCQDFVFQPHENLLLNEVRNPSHLRLLSV